MSAARKQPQKRAPRRASQPRPLRRFFHLHGRLLVCIAIGAAATLLLPADWPLPARLLAGWDGFILLYLAHASVFVVGSSVEQIRSRAAVQDDGAAAILLLTIIAAFASLAALVVLLGGDKSGPQAQPVLRLGFAIATIVLSWLFVHTMFTLHYAHDYYGDRGDERSGGLAFPGDDDPDYWDFLYFSLVIAMTSQVSDVAITGKPIRRVAALHGALSFFFNLGILALTINLLAGAIS